MNISIINGKIYINGQPMHDDDTLVGDGQPGRESRPIDEPFSKLKAGGVIELIVECGAPDHSVEVNCDSNLLLLIETTVKDGTLKVGTRGGPGVSALLPLRVVVRMPALEKIKLDGAAKAVVNGVSGARLRARLSGSSRLELKGSVQQLEVELSGACALEAAALSAGQVRAHFSGASEGKIRAGERLVFEGSGASQLTYTGQPQVESSVSGAARLERLG